MISAASSIGPSAFSLELLYQSCCLVDVDFKGFSVLCLSAVVLCPDTIHDEMVPWRARLPCMTLGVIPSNILDTLSSSFYHNVADMMTSGTGVGTN